MQQINNSNDNRWQEYTELRIKVFSITGDHNSIRTGKECKEICYNFITLGIINRGLPRGKLG